MGEMSKVEEVARAIFDAMDVADGLDGTVARKYAVAAIEAMRVPTAAMVSDVSEGFAVRVPGTIERVYGAMIDAALKE